MDGPYVIMKFSLRNHPVSPRKNEFSNLLLREAEQLGCLSTQSRVGKGAQVSIQTINSHCTLSFPCRASL